MPLLLTGVLFFVFTAFSIAHPEDPFGQSYPILTEIQFFLYFKTKKQIHKTVCDIMFAAHFVYGRADEEDDAAPPEVAEKLGIPAVCRNFRHHFCYISKIQLEIIELRNNKGPLKLVELYMRKRPT